MAGVMHSIKGKLFSGEKHVDAEYDAAFARFTQLHDSLVKLKASSQNYSNSLYSSLFNSNSASIEFANILEEPLSEHGFEVVSKQMQQAHMQLNSDRQSALTARMSESVLVPLDKLILQLLDLNTKITKRNELHTNLEYYLGKTSTLVKEREERGSKGKSESSSQRDKLDRNQHKLDTVRNEYTAYTAPLITELLAVWQTRAVSLGPILAAFASVEKEFVQIYGAAVEQVHPEQIGTAPITSASLSRRPSASPVTAASVGTASTLATAAPANPFATSTSATAAPLTTDAHVRQASSGSNVFGEINEPNSTTHAGQQQAAIVSVPVAVSGSANPFEQQSIPAGSGASYGSLGGAGVEGSAAAAPGGLGGATSQAPLSSIITTTTTTTTSPQQPSLDLLAKNEHEDESKRQRYQEEHKTANIIGV